MLKLFGTPHGDLNEASVILDYLEDTKQGRPLLPADPYARATVGALMKEIELYVELPARSCFAEAFFGGTVPNSIKSKAREDLQAGFATLKRHARFAPYVAGDTFTLADIVFLYSVDLAVTVGKQLFGLDLLEDLPAAQALLQRLNENPHVKAIAAKREAGLPAFVATVRALASDTLDAAASRQPPLRFRGSAGRTAWGDHPVQASIGGASREEA